MKKKSWQETLILIFILIIISSAFLLIKKFWFDSLSGKIEKIELEQARRFEKETQKIIQQGFDFSLFKKKSYQDLKEFISWPPAVIDNQGNPEPFKQITSQ